MGIIYKISRAIIEPYENHAATASYKAVKHGYVKQAKDWQYSTFLRYVKQGFYDENWCDFSQDRDLYE